MEGLPANEEVLDQMMNAGRMASAIERNPKKAGQLATRAFLDQEQREGQPLYEYLSQQEQGVVPSDRSAYASAVEDSLNRPVISVQYAREQVGDTLVPSDAFPSGFLSVRDYINLEGQKAYSEFLKSFRASRGKLSPEVIQMAEQARDRVFVAADDAEGMLAGTLKTTSPYANLMQSTIQRAVAAHSPGGEYAQFGGRTEEDQRKMEAEYGPQAKFMLTSDGRQNYEAQRLLDLWSATDENYGPASTMSQAQRAIGGFTAPIYNRLTRNSTRLAGEEWDEMGRMSKPDGKYGYAAEMYYRSASDNPEVASVYTPEGRPKYESASMTSPKGLGNAMMMNTDYPLANWYQSVGKYVSELPSTIGNALGGGDTNITRNLRELRNRFNRTTPVAPPGVELSDFRKIGEQLQSADERLSGYNSAQLGPKFADAYNSTPLASISGPMERTYLSPAMQTLLEVPAESVSDPINLAFNLAIPAGGAMMAGVRGGVAGGMMAGARQGGGNLIRGLAKSFKRVGGDIVDEQAEALPFGTLTQGFMDYFSPEKNNALLPGSQPTDPDYDQKLQRAAEDANMDKQGAAKRYGELTNRKPQRSQMADPIPKFTVPALM